LIKKNWGQTDQRLFYYQLEQQKLFNFGHQFYANWSIQSLEISKSVKNVIAPEVETAF